MKKNQIIAIIIIIIVIVSIILGIVFATNKNGKDNNESASGKSWENLDVCVDGKWMNFPMTFEKMESYGWKLPVSYANQNIESKMAYKYELVNDDKDYKLGVSILNYDQNTKNIKECMIAGIDVDVKEMVSGAKNYKEKKSHANIKIPINNNITFGMRSDDILEQLGNENTNKYSFYSQDTYSYNNNTKTLSYTTYTYTTKTSEGYSRILNFSVYPETGILGISLLEQIR